MTAPRILLLEDDQTFREVLTDHLESLGYRVDSHGALGDLHWNDNEPYQVALVDHQLPDGDGLEVATRLQQERASTQVVVMSAFADAARAVAAMQLGALDYLEKPLDLTRLETCLARAVAIASQPAQDSRASNDEKREVRKVEDPSPAARLLGVSEAMQSLRAELALAAEAWPSPLLLLGETGTGKSLAARVAHEDSCVSQGPFVEVNCAAIPESLFESELFGSERGAFTGASHARPGLIELASGGSLFLDEIGELAPHVQAKLLGVLESRKVRRLGGRQERAVSFRVIAATHRPLERLVEEGSFRADLYYRLAVLPLRLPPLRERPEDLPTLVSAALESLQAKMPQALVEALVEHLATLPLKGNVRELRNVVERTVLAHRREQRAAGSLPAAATTADEVDLEREARPSSKSRESSETPPASQIRTASKRSMAALSARERFPSLAEAEALHIAEALRRCAGNRTQAARMLGLSRSTLLRRLQQEAS